MVHKKYIKKRGKVFGPYYYENYRENGKTKTKYLGTKPPKETQKNLRVNPKTYFLIILGLLIISTFAYYLTKSEVTEYTPIKSGFLNSSLSLIKSIIGFSFLDDVKDSDIGTTSNTILVLETPENKTKEEEKNKTKEEEEILKEKNKTKEEEEILKEENKTAEETLKNETKTAEGERKALESSRKLEEKAKKNETLVNETTTNITETFSETLIQLDAVIFQPVKWAKRISLKQKGKFKVSLPKQAKNIFVYTLDPENKTNRKEIAKERIEQKIVPKKAPKKKKDMNIFERIFNVLTGRVVLTEETQDALELTKIFLACFGRLTLNFPFCFNEILFAHLTG